MDSTVPGSESLHSSQFPHHQSSCFIPLLFSSYPSFLIQFLPAVHSSLLILPFHCSSLVSGSTPNVALPTPPPRSAQPVCAVKAVGQLQARTGTSSGLEITASAPGAPSSMRKVGTWQGPWALGPGDPPGSGPGSCKGS